MTATLIQAAPVVRAPTGEWLHPDLPDLTVAEYGKFFAWAQTQGLEISYDELRDAQGTDDFPPLAMVTPLPPPGEGWFLIFICEGENGPSCSWARHARGVLQ